MLKTKFIFRKNARDMVFGLDQTKQLAQVIDVCDSDHFP